MGPYVLPLALLIIAFTAPSIAQKTATVLEVAEGAPLTVECELGVQERVAWAADGGAPAPDLRAAESPAPESPGRLVARLHAARARPAHAALYRCAPAAAPVRVIVLSATAHPPPPAGTEPAPAEPAAASEPDEPAPLMFALGQRLEFDCKLGDDDDAAVNYYWYKNESLLSVSAGGGSGGSGGSGADARAPVTERHGRVLVLRRAHEDDFGNYSCVVGGALADGGVRARVWRAHARAQARVPPNTNVIEGQKFSITCKLFGKPYPRVAWTFAPDSSAGNATVLETDGPGARLTTRDAGGVPGGVLEVSAATHADAGVYACVPAGGAAAASTLRVKGVYAALWPFLGICLEVLVLCVIILVYERRRTKPELDDSDADTHDH